MQVVILTAGEGTRLRPLTESIPKALIPVGKQRLIEYALQALPSCIDEVVLVVGYRGEDIKKFLGTRYGPLSLTYVEQGEKKGTAGALWSVRSVLKKDYFLVLNGDDIYSTVDLIPFCASELAFGYAEAQAQGKMLSVVISEGYFKGFTRPSIGDTIFVGTNVFTLDHRIFDTDPVLLGSGEYGLPQTLANISDSELVHTHQLYAWFPINTQGDIVHFETWHNRDSSGTIKE